VFSFAPSLPLGVFSLAEFVDVKLRADLVSLDGVLERLQEASAEGVEFFSAKALGEADKPLSKVVNEIEYVAGVTRELLEVAGVSSAAELESFLSRRREDELRVKRVVKGIGKWVDVKAHLLEVQAGTGQDFLKEAGIGGDFVPMTMRLALGQRGTARAYEVVEALFGTGDASVPLVRSGMYYRTECSRVGPMDLCELRRIGQSTVRSEPAPAGATPAP
jgi:hypothetical protein